MRAIPEELVNWYSEAFAGESAGKKTGFTVREMEAYFQQYGGPIKSRESYDFNPTRRQYFIDCVRSLQPKDRYYALVDLCQKTPTMKYMMPDQSIRDRLLTDLHCYLSKTPIGLTFSALREHTFREDWFKAYNRLTDDPAAAITAARTMLEAVFKTIITERGEKPDSSGDIGKLLKQAEDVLGFETATSQSEHKVLTGLASAINGIAGISNSAGAAALFFIEMHLFLPLASSE